MSTNRPPAGLAPWLAGSLGRDDRVLAVIEGDKRSSAWELTVQANAGALTEQALHCRTRNSTFPVELWVIRGARVVRERGTPRLDVLGRDSGGPIVTFGGVDLADAERMRAAIEGLFARDPTRPAAWGLPEELDRVPGGAMDMPRHGVSGPSPVAERYPLLDRCLTAMHTPIRVTLRTVPPSPELLAAASSSDWSDDAQRAFDACWPSEFDGWVDGLIDTYGSQWHNAFNVLAPVHRPEYADLLRERAVRGEIELTGRARGDADLTVMVALGSGPVRNQVLRRTWDYPTRAVCAVCGAEHLFDLVDYTGLRDHGAAGICQPCRIAARAGPPGHVFAAVDRDSQLQALRDLADVTGAIPPQAFRDAIQTVGLPKDRRAEIVAALITTPRQELLRGHDFSRGTTGQPWIAVLQESGLVGEVWRTGRGFMCLAADGHVCRSLGERTIDDWLHAHGVPHELEPTYPQHPEFNPGRMRADWLVGGTFVEYAGMLSDPTYAAKMRTKQRLAQAVGVQLIVIAPEDLYLLDDLLGRFDATSET